MTDAELLAKIRDAMRDNPLDAYLAVYRLLFGREPTGEEPVVNHPGGGCGR